MLDRVLIIGIELAEKSQMNFQHVCFVVKGKSILNADINKGNQADSFHAEECALTHNVHPKYIQQGYYGEEAL